MKATETRLFKFLQKSAQFIIPIYQRKYSWSIDQCEQLWKDIVSAGSSSLEAHFIGSVVYVERGLYSHSDVPQLLVIDGQQRLTSTTLLIAALVSEMKNLSAEGVVLSMGGTTPTKLKKYYLCNDAEEGDLFYKLVLTKADNQALRDVINEKDMADQASDVRVIQNFLWFKAQIKNQTNDVLEHVYSGLQKLIIVDIALDRDKDNPQLIFESLNSTGLDLSQADLIRNYVLMGLEPQQQNTLYHDHWYPMEEKFGHGECSWLFNQFIRDYLTVKTGKPPRIGDVYKEFKHYTQSSNNRLSEIVADVHQYSKFYIAFAKETEEKPKLLEAFKDINAYTVEVAYPLILELYHDYHFGILTESEFESCVRLIESYVFRRFVCDIPTNSLNKTFAGFSKGLRKEKYLESFKAEWLKLAGYRRYPADEEFKRCLALKDMYNVRSRAYWLRRLENNGRKERVIVEDYTIEHVMPQQENLSEQWQTELGDDWKSVHETYLHTIGNLTLTGYNSELSAKPFSIKRDMVGGFAQSPLKLNKSLALLKRWNEDEIKQRAENLSEEMIKVWGYPYLDDGVLATYHQMPVIADYSLEDHPFISKGASSELYQKFRAQVLALDDNIKEEFLKLYVAFKLDTNIVDLVPQASGLRLFLNGKFVDIHDPKGVCRDVSHIGRWGNGDIELKITQVADLPYAIQLVQQVLDRQLEG
ncbi:MAG: GmrSD restriction endonuclease domain-containing protein [Marinomonas foliarum]|uniref:GmrSD restriction endonuclease domain-containing protein n=1 Tax=Marinomonas foliarum TaxID=491950 RepID=UPI003F965924